MKSGLQHRAIKASILSPTTAGKEPTVCISQPAKARVQTNSGRARAALLTIIVAAFPALTPARMVSLTSRWREPTAGTPDLRIREFSFPTGKSVRVHVVNTGSVASLACVLRLTLRKIDGVPVGRVTEIRLPSILPGKERWFVIDASRILPGGISLASTTFKLNADATSLVTESDEANNEVWHNL